MLCRKCRKEIPADSVYCNYCGTNQTLSHKPKSRGNGQGSVYKRSNGSWQAEVTIGYKLDENGIRRRIARYKSGFKTKKEALDYLPKLYGIVEKQKEIKIFELYDILKKRDIDNLSKSKQTHYSTAYKRLKCIENRYISSLTLAELQDIFDETNLGFYPQRDMKNLLSKMYEYALIDDFCKKNVAQYITLPKQSDTEERPTFSDEDIKKLKEAWQNGSEIAGCILIMIFVGLRTGELLNIKSENVHLDKSIMYGGIKTDKGKKRPLIIIDEVREIVEHFYNQNNEQLVKNDRKEFYAAWSSLRAELGLREELVPYCARHTCATRLSNADVPPSVIMDILGHDKYDTTMHYTHNYIEQLKNGLEKIV